MSPSHPLLEPLRALHREIRAGVLAACRSSETAALAEIAEDAEGDTIFAIDKVGEAVLVPLLEREAARFGGIVLVAEGIASGFLCLPEGRPADACRYRVIVDPIDGTRGLMYQKRPAWILTGVAPNRGGETRLSDVELAVQTELPLVKQHLADELWAVRGAGARAERVNVLDGSRAALELRPSAAQSVEHGFAMISRLFPGARDELAALDEAIIEALIGPPVPGKARCFEDQYASSGGQLYELMAGHDRFTADLRPLLGPLLARKGLTSGLCCHPYDVCTALIAQELGVVLRSPEGGPLDAALDLEEDVAWVGYANAGLAAQIEPLLKRELALRGFARSPA